jgi:hypothetical protein
MTLNNAFSCDISSAAMNTSSFNLGRYSRLALLLLMLAAQGIAVAHDIGDSHSLKSDPCASCIIGHGLGTAVTSGCEALPLPVCQPAVPARSNAAPLASPTHCHLARAPPVSSRNT